MKRLGNFLFGSICGGLVGAALALLFAPSSGEEMRGQASQRYHAIQEEVASAASSRRAELEQQLADLRKPRKAETP